MSIKYDNKEIQTFASISDVLYRNIRDPNTISATPSKQNKNVSLCISDLSESSLFILSKENIIRKFLIKIVLSKWFDKPLSKLFPLFLPRFPCFPARSAGPAEPQPAGRAAKRKRRKEGREGWQDEFLGNCDGEIG